MRAAVTDDERRFDLCDGCGLLWHVERTLGRAVAHRVAVRTAPGRPASPGTDRRPVDRASDPGI